MAMLMPACEEAGLCDAQGWWAIQLKSGTPTQHRLSKEGRCRENAAHDGIDPL